MAPDVKTEALGGAALLEHKRKRRECLAAHGSCPAAEHEQCH